jgi:hypothetical protein
MKQSRRCGELGSDIPILFTPKLAADRRRRVSHGTWRPATDLRQSLQICVSETHATETIPRRQSIFVTGNKISCRCGTNLSTAYWALTDHDEFRAKLTRTAHTKRGIFRMTWSLPCISEMSNKERRRSTPRLFH